MIIIRFLPSATPNKVRYSSSLWLQKLLFHLQVLHSAARVVKDFSLGLVRGTSQLLCGCFNHRATIAARQTTTTTTTTTKKHCISSDRVTAERNSPARFCHNMLAIVLLHLKKKKKERNSPWKFLESFPLFLKEKGAFVWKWGTPGNDRHSLWSI